MDQACSVFFVKAIKPSLLMKHFLWGMFLFNIGIFARDNVKEATIARTLYLLKDNTVDASFLRTKLKTIFNLASKNTALEVRRALDAAIEVRAPRPGAPSASQGSSTLYEVPRDLNIDGDVHVGGTLSITSDLNVPGTLTAGDIVLTGDLNVPGTLTAGDIVLTGDLNVPGTLTAGDIVLTGDLDVPGNLSVQGTTTVSDTNVVDGSLAIKQTVGGKQLDIGIDGEGTAPSGYLGTRSPTSFVMKASSTSGAITFEPSTYNITLSATSAGTVSFNPASGTISIDQSTATTSAPSFTGLNISNQGTLKLYEATGGGTNFAAIRAPAALAADYTLTLPVDDGTANQVLTTDGSGGLSWTSVAPTGSYFANGGNAFGVASAILGTTDAFGLRIQTEGSDRITIANAAGSGAIAIPAFSTAGVVHNAVTTGILSSSLIVNADVDAAAGIVDTKLATISTAGKVSNSATTAASANTASAIVARDASGNFAAGTISATALSNNAGAALTVGTSDAQALNLQTNSADRITIGSTGTIAVPAFSTAGIVHNAVTTGVLSSSLIVNADIDAAAGIVDTKLATISTAGKVSNSATTAASANTASAIVARDASGNFAAGTISLENQGSLKLYEATAGGTNFAAIRAPAALTADYTLTLPVDDGTANQVLTTDGSGGLSWTSVAPTGSYFANGGNAFGVASAILGTTDAFGLRIQTEGSDRITIANAAGSGAIAIPAFSTAGIVHNAVTTGILSSSLIVNADVDAAAGIVDTKLATISTAGKVSNSATTATSANTASAIVARDASGNFSAGTISATTLSTSSIIYADGSGIDVTATAGTDTLNIGTTNAEVINLGTASTVQTINMGTGTGVTTINIGGSGDTVNIGGTLTWVKTTDLQVTDKLITINKDGAAASGDDAGIQVEENLVNTAYVKTGNTRASWLLKAPATAGIVTITPGASGFTLNQGVATTDSPSFVGLTLSGMTVAGVVHNAVTTGILSSSLIVNADVDAAAGIVDTKLATISTAGKVSNSATTATSANTASAIVARDASGNFAAGTISLENQGSLKLYEATAGGTNFAAIRAPAALTADYTLTLPVDDGTANQVLTTDGSGGLSWTSVAPTGSYFANGGNAFGVASAILGTTDAFGLRIQTEGSDRITIANAAGSGAIAIPAFSTAGVVHNAVTTGILSSSLIVNADVDAAAGIVDTKLATISTAGKVSNSATTATSANTASAIVARDASGNFAAGTISATALSNNAGAALTVGTSDAQALNLQTNATTRISVDSSGNTTYSSKYKAAAYVGTNITPATAVSTVVFDTENYDPNSNYVNTTGIYTAPVTGLYFVTAQICAQIGEVGTKEVGVFLNGTVTVIPGAQAKIVVPTLISSDSGTDTRMINLVSVVSLTASDTIRVRYSGATADTLLADSSSISIHYMSFTPA